MSVPYFPKSIHLITAGFNEVALAFKGQAGTFNVWQAQQVPRQIAVEIKTAVVDNRPGGEIETIVQVTPKEFLPHPVAFMLTHQTEAGQPPEVVAVTVSQVLLAQ